MKPVLALVGRPNVGKSTLFNRLTKSRDAIVADFAGLTRDRHYGQGRLGQREYIVIDTGDQKGFFENDWVGKTIRIGDSVRLHITDPCPRCIMPTLAQGDLPRDLDVMNKGILQNRVMVPFAGKALPSIGVYARVIAGGTIRHGDTIIVES